MKNRALSVHKEHELLLKLEEAGLGDTEAQAIVQSRGNQLAKKVIAFIRRGGYEPQGLAAEWENFYQRVLGITVDLSGAKVPTHKPTPDFSRIVMVAGGLTFNQVWEACKRHFPTWSYCGDDLDKAVPVNDRITAKSYAIRIRDRQEADEELKKLSANLLKEKGIQGITFLERLLLELKYHDETGQHLDRENVTLCSGSRYSDGFVPSVDWFGGGLFVRWCLPADAGSCLRSRAVVS